MPNFNGTGPNGMGPMTGRGFGYCTGARSATGFYSGGMGRGFGRGLGRSFSGRGFQQNFYSNEMSRENAGIYLNNRAAALEEELQAVRAELKELNSGKKEE